MAELSDMAWVEARKALRSGMPVWTALGAFFLPLAIGFLIFVARNPEVSQKLGLVGAKANLTAYAGTNWPSYLGLITQVIAAGGFFLFVLVLSWIFGREFVDGTAKDLLAVPVRRSSILLAKFLVGAVWSVLLSTVIFVVGVAAGGAIGLPGGSAAVIFEGTIAAEVMACLIVAVALPFALFASAGRGYLLPLGLALLVALLTNLAAVLGWGGYFPWAVPAVYAESPGAVAPISYVIVLLTGLAGMGGTYLWWKLADQNR